MADDAAWYQALNLAERARGFASSQTFLPLHNPKANRLFQEWRAQSPFQDDAWFEKRLSLDYLSQDDFRTILAEPCARLRTRWAESPSWLAEVLTAYNGGGLLNVQLPEGHINESSMAFWPLIEPVFRRFAEKLHRGARQVARAHPTPPFNADDVTRLFHAPARRQLSLMISQTCVLEMHVANHRGRLTGDTPEARFQSFVRLLEDRTFSLALLQEYPVLARLVTEWLDSWVEANLEFLQRLAQDWYLICTELSPMQEPGELIEVTGGISDRHRRGRSVLIARFSSGLKLVYKPKSLSIDVHFSSLLAWLNHKGAPNLRCPKVLDRGSYGWSEFVAAVPCAGAEEVQMFYRRQGAFLALLYVLEATDFHNENLIAAGAHPMLVDLESLFHVQPREGNASHARYMAEFLMTNSVLRVGLLPQRQWDKDGTQSIDLSGLGGDDSQISPWRVPLWEKGGTDEMRLVRRQVKINAAANRPSWEAESINPLNFSDAILEGFTSMYRLLLDHREELCAEHGPLAQFADDEVRAIFRQTRFYAKLRSESLHPHLLGNSLERERIFDRLWLGLDCDPLADKILQIIPSERNDLWASDIPFFSTRVDSRHVWDSRGQRIPDFFRESGLQAAKQRIAKLSEADLKKQRWFISSSLITFAMDTEPRRRIYVLRDPPPLESGVLRNRLLSMARRVGARLEQLAVRGNGDASWIGLKIRGGRHWTLSPLGVDLYSGSAGIALFLAYLGELTGDGECTSLAKEAIAGIHKQEDWLQKNLESVGAFEGWAGLLYTYMHLAVLWQSDELRNKSEQIIRQVALRFASDEALDVIGGSASAIVTLIGFQQVAGTSLLPLAREMGERLVLRAEAAEQGVAWKVSANPERPLAGFSHGTAGIAWALLALHRATGEEKFKDTALQALQFERCAFSPAFGNWLDLRGAMHGEAKPKFMTAWCHGAPGIGLSRLRMLQQLGMEQTRDEIEIALRTTLSRGFGANHCLCHGDLGNLELFLEAGLTLDDPALRNQADRLAAQILCSMDEHGWICGVPLGVETPGFMNGLAGIGYGLLRAAAPDQVPSVLLLDPPRPTSQAALS